MTYIQAEQSRSTSVEKDEKFLRRANASTVKDFDIENHFGHDVSDHRGQSTARKSI
jgi:hypothetical protein